MAKKRVSIEDWLVEALSDPDKGGPCTAVSLVYIKPGSGNAEEIHTKQLKQGATHNSKSLSDFFMNKACGYAQDLPGIQTFKMLAFYNGSDQAKAALPFTVTDGEMTAGGDVPFSRHEPSEKGLLAQLMKHNESMASMLMQISQTVTVQAVLREQQLRGEVAEANVIIRDVIMNMTDKQNAHALAVLAYQRETGERKMLADALPMGINYLLGKEVIPAQYADSKILDAIAEKVKPEHLTLLVSMGILTQEQSTVLAARFAKTLEEKAKERALLKSIPGEDNKPPEQGQSGATANTE